ncbi:sigma-54-dependent Fis family transcriptional regulator [Rhodopseudomonas sp. P2A-2r]|uniref:sigma-54-dependent Fis family transcriptional regulator n=1 Tax=unclassified Rhodopseudomonas TaxID=2638247 RepID=UPI002234A728|nr:sigma-54-dependent Fis family transcriptional regulator [Rhodopseudomonas sp. P2A-2r]UZE50058.1 sigma-54-dependent Fis family transcriptional regulator [Rhodopseudomonas sp. P2A-2r]
MANLAARNHVERVLAVAASEMAVEGEPRIVRSWKRCLVDHKLDPARAGPPRTLMQSELKYRAERVDRLLHLAMPELDNLYGLVRDTGYCVNLADANATILFSRLPDGEAATLMRQWKIYTGSVFAEATEGTNGLGTALAEQRAILVHRDEHFREQWSMFSCAVVPVFDHAGHLAGAVNITSCRGDLDRAAHQLALALTTQAVRRIEEAIFRSSFHDGWIATLPGGSAMIAFDDDQRVLGASRAARDSLGLSDAMIETGHPLSQFIQFDSTSARRPGVAQALRDREGRHLGEGHVSSPTRARRPAASHAARTADRPAIHHEALAELAGGDPALQRSVRRLLMVVDKDIPVLLRGETGSGKDVFARAIHAASGRAGGHYVALNCAAMPESLIDAELFGYESGAFTGARRDGSRGLIVQADGGTLFLDEIGDMPLALQTRLLRVLENREVWPLGARKPVAVNIRLVSATHRDLEAMVAEGGFRADLYYRLRGLQVDLPALRARADKTELIARIAAEEAPQLRMSSAAWETLLAHPFPGNIRQLRHVLRLSACTAEGGIIAEADLDLPPCSDGATPGLKAAERHVIAEALNRHHGDVADAARTLHISRATLYRKIKALKIAVTDH